LKRKERETTFGVDLSRLAGLANVRASYDGDGRRVAKIGSKLYWPSFGIGFAAWL